MDEEKRKRLEKKRKKKEKERKDAIFRERRIRRREKRSKREREFQLFHAAQEQGEDAIPLPKHKKGGKRCSVNLRGVPVILRDQFKAACIDRGETMRDAMIRMMTEAVRYRFDVFKGIK